MQAVVGRGRDLGRTATLAKNPAPVAFGCSAPNARLLAKTERMVQAGRPYCAPVAHRLSGSRFGLVFGIEDRSLQPSAGSEVPPLVVLRTDLLYRHVIAPIGPD